MPRRGHSKVKMNARRVQAPNGEDYQVDIEFPVLVDGEELTGSLSLRLPGALSVGALDGDGFRATKHLAVGAMEPLTLADFMPLPAKLALRGAQAVSEAAQAARQGHEEAKRQLSDIEQSPDPRGADTVRFFR